MASDSEEEVEIQTSDEEEEAEELEDDEEVEEEEEEEEGSKEANALIDTFKCGKCGDLDKNFVMLIHYGCKNRVFCCTCRDESIAQTKVVQDRPLNIECGGCGGESVNPRTIQWCPETQDRFYQSSKVVCPICSLFFAYNDIKLHVYACATRENKPLSAEAKRLIKTNETHTKKIAIYNKQLCFFMMAAEAQEERQKEARNLLKEKKKALKRERKMRDSELLNPTPQKSRPEKRQRVTVDLATALNFVLND